MEIVKTELVYADTWIYDNQPVLHLTYHLTFQDGQVDEIDIPAIRLNNGVLPGLDIGSAGYLDYEAEIDFNGSLPLMFIDGHAWTQKCIRQPTKKMTVAEIEKKLGHRVEIISEEDTDDN